MKSDITSLFNGHVNCEKYVIPVIILFLMSMILNVSLLEEDTEYEEMYHALC